jgi:hypothetical protein
LGRYLTRKGQFSRSFHMNLKGMREEIGRKYHQANEEIQLRIPPKPDKRVGQELQKLLANGEYGLFAPQGKISSRMFFER